MLRRTAAICIAAALLLCACGHSTGSVLPKPAAQTLRITYSSGKYGDEWIKSLADDYMSLHRDVNIVLTGDSQLDSKVGYTLVAGTQKADIIFMSKTNWQTWAVKGYMTPLDSLYSSKVYGNVSFSSRLRKELAPECRCGSANYVVPWGDGAAGIIYNKKLFDTNGWQVPTTVSELASLEIEMRAAQCIPFSWSAKDSSFLDDMVKDWWLQYEGRSGMDTYLALGSPEVYRQEGRLAALKAFQSLFSSQFNSVDSPATVDSKKAADIFYGGSAAMMPGGYLPMLETKYKPPAGFTAAVMSLPAVSGAKQANLSATFAGGFAFVPSSSANNVLAEDFLLYTATDRAIAIFSNKTGCPAPYNYSMSSVIGLDSLARSEAEVWRATDKYIMHSDNPKYYSEFSDWPYNGSPVMRIFYGTVTPKQAVDSNYEYVKTHWNKQSTE